MEIKVEILKDKNGVELCTEFYYQLVDKEEQLYPWYLGLELVYTLDPNDKLDFDYAVTKIDDDQEFMAYVITKVVSEVNPDIVINSLFINYKLNSDGSENLIKNICITFLMPNGQYMVCRAPLYAFTKETREFVKGE